MATSVVAAAGLMTATAGPAAAGHSTFAFPSAGSTVVASDGVVGPGQYGGFWSAARGDSVTETFSGPVAVNRAVLRLGVPSNSLSAGNGVDWAVEVNGQVVGSFSVAAGETGTKVVDLSFPPIAGPDYTVSIRVTNEVPTFGGSIFLAFDGPGAGSLELYPATVSDKDQCKKGGWQNLTDDEGNTFRNQGQCVSSTNKKKSK